ncbi:MAG: NrfD/PsrC family molybdoenzyme membrane anchor subunit [Dehalococcoidia bacterium]
MATRTDTRSLPYGIGHFGPVWVLVFVVALGVVALGAYGYSRQIIEGEHVTGLRDIGTMGGAPWGLYVAFELSFVGIGFGAMMLIALFRLLGITHLRPLTRMLGVISITTLFIGGWSIIADLGQPLRAILNILRYARPMSPFFGTVTIGLVAAFAVIIVYLYLFSRRDAAILARRATRWSGFLRFVAAGYQDTEAEQARRRRVSAVLAVALAVIGIGAASTSGFVFGFQQGRPGWFGALQAPGFVVRAAATGTAACIVVAVILRRALRERERLNLRVFAWLSNMMLATTVAYIYFLLVEVLTARYSATAEETRVTDALLTGEFAWIFWLSAALFAVAVLITGYQAAARRYSLALIVFAAVAVIGAGFLKRYLLVVPPLTKGQLMPYVDGSYSPTWVEYAVVAGLIGLGVVVYMLFMKVFPIMEVGDER